MQPCRRSHPECRLDEWPWCACALQAGRPCGWVPSANEWQMWCSVSPLTSKSSSRLSGSRISFAQCLAYSLSMCRMVARLATISSKIDFVSEDDSDSIFDLSFSPLRRELKASSFLVYSSLVLKAFDLSTQILAMDAQESVLSLASIKTLMLPQTIFAIV